MVLIKEAEVAFDEATCPLKEGDFKGGVSEAKDHIICFKTHEAFGKIAEVRWHNELNGRRGF